MKNRKLTFITLVALLVLLITAAGAYATTRTPFTGTMEWLTDQMPGRYWEPGSNAFMWRDFPIIFGVETDNPLVGGRMYVSHNGNYRWAPESPKGLSAHTWGTFRIEPDLDDIAGNNPDYWEGTFSGDLDEYGYEVNKCLAKGYGAYAGLQLRVTSSSGPYDELWALEGEILDPGK